MHTDHDIVVDNSGCIGRQLNAQALDLRHDQHIEQLLQRTCTREAPNRLLAPLLPIYFSFGVFVVIYLFIYYSILLKLFLFNVSLLFLRVCVFLRVSTSCSIFDGWMALRVNETTSASSSRCI